MISPVEKHFLTALAKQRQGRCGFDLVNREQAMDAVSGLLDRGLIRERRFEKREGLQITAEGREFLGGVVS